MSVEAELYASAGQGPEPQVHRQGRYVFFAPWPVKHGAGVNNVVLALRDAAARVYEPVIAVTSWQPPIEGQIQLKLRSPTAAPKELIAFVVFLVPDLLRLRKLARNAVALNPHYIGLHLLPLAILRKLRLGPKLILSVHGSDVTEALSTRGLDRALFRWLLSAADLVVACSGALGAKVREISPSANVVSVWNAIDPPSYVPEERPLDAPYVICVAAYWHNKGHDLLLEAFDRIWRKYPSLHLVLIGGLGPELGAVEDLVAARGLKERTHIFVHLPHEEVWGWIKHAECLVLPSRNEAFGLCILEAGLVRTPVVASRVGGVPELLGDDERGLLCEPESPESLAEAVLRTLSDKQSAIARSEALHRMVQGLTWSDAFEKYRTAGRLP